MYLSVRAVSYTVLKNGIALRPDTRLVLPHLFKFSHPHNSSFLFYNAFLSETEMQSPSLAWMTSPKTLSALQPLKIFCIVNYIDG